jgi:xanthine dehydrogenase YagR molybdenum-binding subunit
MIGAGLPRVDGRAKVTGAARYSYEEPLANVAYGVIVTSTIAAGRITAIDVAEARSLPGVLAVLTHDNAPRVRQDAAGEPGADGQADRKLMLLQDDRVLYDRQPVALVIADTLERATDAADRVTVSYAADTPAATMESPGAVVYTPAKANQVPTDSSRGDFDAAFATAPIKLDLRYVTPTEFHNPMEPHAALAAWHGDELTVYDSSQGVFARQASIAKILGIAPANVRVITKFVGGGFGSKGGTNAHTLLAAMGSRVVGRPVKIALTRPQMFGGFGYRPRTEQHLTIGAASDGKLIAVSHDVRSQTSRYDEFIESSAAITRMLYAAPNVRTTHRGVRYDVVTPTYMRAPGESSGSFALESAMDELAYAVGVDPLALRLRNYAETDPDEEKPFSSKSLRRCYTEAAERFGWSQRAPQVRARRTNDGMLVGMGMATSTYPTNRSTAAATATVYADGSAYVVSGGTDLGTGAYTAFTQIAAQALAMDVARVRFDLGDTQMPEAPVAGGSQLTASVANAVQKAGDALRRKLAAAAIADPNSPLHGHREDELSFAQGRISLRERPAVSDTYVAILSRAGQQSLSANAEAEADRKKKGPYSSHAFGTHFAEVHVDPDLGMVRVTRVVSAFAAGRIVNARTAHSQYLGGVVWGIATALHEEGRIDERTARYMNANLADYLVPVNADIPDVEIILVDEEDPYVNPLGIKGIGEVGNVGSAAAVANAVYHATGIRIRELPITPDKLIAS